MKLYLQESQWGTECTGQTRQTTLTLLSLLQGGGNADVQRAEPVAPSGFILLQWCYNPATRLRLFFEWFAFGYRRSVDWLEPLGRLAIAERLKGCF